MEFRRDESNESAPAPQPPREADTRRYRDGECFQVGPFRVSMTGSSGGEVVIELRVRGGEWRPLLVVDDFPRMSREGNTDEVSPQLYLHFGADEPRAVVDIAVEWSRQDGERIARVESAIERTAS